MRSGIQCASAQARAPPSGARGALAGDARGGAVVLGVRPSHRRSGAARRPTFQASPREPHRESPSLREPQPADFVECTDAHLAIAAACAGRRGVPGASERPRACSQRRRSESPSVRAPSPESPKSREPSGLSRRGALTRAQGSQGGALVTPAAVTEPPLHKAAAIFFREPMVLSACDEYFFVSQKTQHGPVTLAEL